MELFPQGVVAIDVETTGLSPLTDRIIELSAVKVTSSGVQTLDQIINPGIPIPQFTTDIHGIKDEDVQNKPRLVEAFPKILEFLGDLPIIAHNAKFDAGFFVFALHQTKFELPRNPIYCTVKIGRVVFPNSENHKLGTLSTFLEIPLENHHCALDDAYASLRIFSKALIADISKGQLKEGLRQAKLFNLKDFSKNPFDEIPEALKELKRFCENQQVVEIKYKGGSYKGKLRPIKPIALLPMPEGNILYAHCLLSDMYKSFSLKKINKLKEIDAEAIRQHLLNLKKQKMESKK